MKRVELKTGIAAELNGTEVTLKHWDTVLYSGDIAELAATNYGMVLFDLCRSGAVCYVTTDESPEALQALEAARAAFEAATERADELFDATQVTVESEAADEAARIANDAYKVAAKRVGHYVEA